MIVDNDDKNMDMDMDMIKDQYEYNEEVITDEVNIEMTKGILSTNQTEDDNSSK